jgi:ParB family chromosome partitioning protein
MEISELSQEDLALRVGKNRSTVANALRLLRLPEPMRDALADGRLTSGHGRALLSLEDEAGRDRLFHEILDGTLSVREAERRASAWNAGNAAPPEQDRGAETEPAGPESSAKAESTKVEGQDAPEPLSREFPPEPSAGPEMPGVPVTPGVPATPGVTGTPETPPAAPRRDPELAVMEQRFIDTLGTKVTLSGDFSRGTIRIDYYSMDDLDRLLGIMGGR